jgi:pimeloyl-ACP methyl ester carboxylesterase
MTETETHTLERPGATLTYEVRAAETDGPAPVLLMIGAPMGASGFVALARQFPERTVVTYDPRGTGRSPLGSEVVIFPGDHGGFLEQGDPSAFADTLRGALANAR